MSSAPLQFTGKERDAETGNAPSASRMHLRDDYFGALYYSSSFGRFLSPHRSATAEPVPGVYPERSRRAVFGDPPRCLYKPGAVRIVRIGPQSLNLYLYVRDDPVSRADLDGHGPCPGGGDNCASKPSQRRKSALQSKNSSKASAQQKNPPNTTFGQKVTLAIQAWAATSGSPLALALTRYMGKTEADTAKSTGAIPNTDASGTPRPTHFTKDEPTNDAEEAQGKYELEQAPEFRATVPDERAPNLRVPDSGPTTSGGGSQVVTDEPVPVFPEEISPMEMPEMPEIPIDPFIFPF